MFIWERISEWSAWCSNVCTCNCLGINKMARSRQCECATNSKTNKQVDAAELHWHWLRWVSARWSEVSKQKWRMSADWYYPVRSYTHLHTHTEQTDNMAVESRMDFHLAFPLRPYFICAVGLSYGRDCKTFVIRQVHSRCLHIRYARSLAFLLNIKMSGTFTIIGLLTYSTINHGSLALHLHIMQAVY